MVSDEQIKLYRRAVSILLDKYRYAIYVYNGKRSFPTDATIAASIGITPAAFSSISRSCASMSGITLRVMLVRMSLIMDSVDFLGCLSSFVLDV